MRIGVVSKLTADRRHTRDDVCAVFFHVASKHEESRLGTVLLQCIEKISGVDTRTVIEGQRNHHRTVAVRLINALIIKVAAFAADRFPACRHVAVGIKVVLISVDIRPAVRVVSRSIGRIPPA